MTIIMGEELCAVLIIIFASSSTWFFEAFVLLHMFTIMYWSRVDWLRHSGKECLGGCRGVCVCEFFVCCRYAFQLDDFLELDLPRSYAVSGSAHAHRTPQANVLTVIGCVRSYGTLPSRLSFVRFWSE